MNSLDFPNNTLQADSSKSDTTTLSTTLAEINYLARSHNRFRILELICASSCSQDDLQKQLDIHRTTLRKNLRGLEKRSWIENIPTNNVYRVLPAGQIVLQSLRTTLANFQTADCLGDFLALFPKELPIQMQTLCACNVTHCETQNPYAPMQRSLTLVKEAEIIRAFTPVFNPIYVETFEHPISDDHAFEIIVSQDVFETIQSDHTSTLEAALQAESVQLFVSDDVPRFGIALLDDIAVIAVYDRDMRVHSLLEADIGQQQVIEWAKQQYDRLKKTADKYEKLGEKDVTPR